jgi:hypothetical protein
MNPLHSQEPSRVQGRTREQRNLLSPIAIETLDFKCNGNNLSSAAR